jgi:molybdate transport system ATP-binding protein
VSLRKRLAQAGSRFDLDVAFASSAKRLALCGPSGSGKTQTLMMIAGIRRPDSGRVAIAGRLLHDSASGASLGPQQRRLAVVFQDYALFPHLTVRQNIAFALCGGWTNPHRAFADPRVERWIGTFDLEAVAGHYPHQLSGGQRQRTALARSLVVEPAAMLLDEPFAALDRGLQGHLRAELKALLDEIRLPMLLVTHDEDDAAELAEETVQLQGGRVVASEEARW